MSSLILAAADVVGQAERTQVMLEKGPITAVAAFFIVGFFILLFLLLRSKDKAATAMSLKEKEHTKAIEAVHAETRERSIKLELALYGMLDMMDDIRLLAFEARHTRELKEKRAAQRGNRPSQSQKELKPVNDKPEEE